MAFKLMMSAQKKWRKLDGQKRLPEIIKGLSSATASANFKPPLDQASPTFAHISMFAANWIRERMRVSNKVQVSFLFLRVRDSGMILSVAEISFESFEPALISPTRRSVSIRSISS